MYGCWRQFKCKLTYEIRELAKGPDAATHIALLKPANVLDPEKWDPFVEHRLSPEFNVSFVN